MSDIVIVGAGPAGLAVGACLERMGSRATLLERASSVGSSWRRHYDRLHLHTARQHSTLPGLDFPLGTPRWPSRQDVIDYLEAYAEHHRLDIRFGVSVRRVWRSGDAWAIATDGEELRARFVVLATGYPRVPSMPRWPGRDRFRGEVMHSSEYRSGERFRGKRVLVVGFGNSGGEIAIDLHEHGARPAIAVRGAVNVIPREILGLPVLAIGIATAWMPARIADALSAPMVRASIGDIRKLGLRKLPYGPMRQIKERGRIPLIDVGTLALVRDGRVGLRGDVRALDADGVVFEDGAREPFDAIVAATGYEPRLDEIAPDVPLDEHGSPRSSGSEIAPGLYACGFRVVPTGMLREIGLEAERVARLIRSMARAAHQQGP